MPKVWNNVRRMWEIKRIGLPGGQFKVFPEVTTGPLSEKNTFPTMEEAEQAIAKHELWLEKGDDNGKED